MVNFYSFNSEYMYTYIYYSNIMVEHVSDKKFITDFKGFSGCKLKMYSQNGSYFVRKISKSKPYNDRLIMQMKKQQQFLQEYSNDTITAPKILDSGFEDELFYFDMEYVSGISLLEHISNADTRNLVNICEVLLQMIELMKQTSDETTSDIISKSQEKIDFIIQFSKEHDLDAEIHDLILQLKNFSNEISIEIPKKTFCHGDLTMENIMYDKVTNKFYLIDFLDSYSDTHWIDIAKIFQDIEGRWYELRFGNKEYININNLKSKILFMENYLKRRLEETEPSYTEIHYFLVALTFARIIPYATEKELPFINDKVNKLVNKSLIRAWR